MDPETLLLAGFAVLLAGAIAAWAVGSRRPAWLRATGLAAIAGAAACFGLVSIQVLRSGAPLGPVALWQPSILPATLSIRVDALSAFFLLLIAGLSTAAAWFAVGYTRTMAHPGRFYPPLLLFVFGMAGVVVLDDFLFFFVPWEFMALASYLLVVSHREQAGSLSAGFRYFFVTHAGTLAALFGVALLAGAGGSSFGFGDLAASMPALLAVRPALAHGALLLILLGFLVKAGCFPFGAWWLPAAHPAAPSPASALLSGAMIKLGLYGILRVFFEILPVGPWSLGWGLTIAAFGTLSLFAGTVTALFQRDSKRLLAWSSIGQVGYMLLGFGLALGLAVSHPVLAAVALTGGLFHLLNHACFKGLLFLGAGSFELATGQRDLDRLGGLGRVVPLTALSVVVASASIAGLPPFNGFSSKWLLYHASIWGSEGPRVAFLFFGIASLFISAVTLALFIEFLGATVWGPPSPEVERAAPPREAPWIGPAQLALATVCILLGLFPVAGAWLSYVAAQPLSAGLGVPAFDSLFGPGRWSMEVRDAGVVVGTWSPLAVTAILALAFGVAAGIRRSAGAARRATTAWACGSVVEAEQLRFRARHYYTPLKALLRPLVIPAVPAAWRAEARRLRPSPRLVTATLNPDGWAYGPIVTGLLSAFRWLSASKVGLPQVYPAWNLIGLVLSFLVLFLLWR
jgi:hydrogenase-4 component B